MTWWLWVLVGFVLLGLEALTPGGFFVLFFGLAAVLIGLLGALGLSGPAWVQWLLFSLLSVGSLVLFRRRLVERLSTTALPRSAASSATSRCCSTICRQARSARRSCAGRRGPCGTTA